MGHLRELGSGVRRVLASVLLLLVLLISTSGLECQKFFLPFFSYVSFKEPGSASILGNSLMNMLPFCHYSRDNLESVAFYREELLEEQTAAKEENATKPEAMEEQTQGDAVQGEQKQGDTARQDAVQGEQREMENVLSASGERPEEAMIAEALTLEELFMQENAATFSFTPAGKVAEYDWTAMSDYETLLSTFYAIDKYALAGNDLFNLESLKNRDLTISKTDAAPQILIYHTHSKEAFADSAPGDASQTIVGVGEFLAQILTNQYGYGVLHHTQEYDTVRDDAYAKSLPAIEKLLEENPSIQVIIDLHRDAGNANRDMVVDINGRKTAKFMFFNGISRSKKTGDIEYLHNPKLQDNLAFSFQMQAAAGEYYPGLTRKIYIKQYRYNMHLLGRTLLVELGDENNTVEEAQNACYPLAHILDMVLSGTAQ